MTARGNWGKVSDTAMEICMTDLYTLAPDALPTSSMYLLMPLIIEVAACV